MIFLIGSERSGTNLIRVLLGNHSRISAPAPIHLLDLLRTRTELLHPGSASAACALADKLETFANHAFSDWKLRLSEHFVEDLPKMSAFDIMHRMYTEKAQADGADVYFNKDNHLHTYGAGIMAHVPQARFIWIYRNPLDQVASWMKTPVHIRTPYAAARKWEADQSACLQLAKFYGAQVHRVAYEDLIENTHIVVERALAFAGLEMESACAQTRKDNKDAAKHVLWQNLDKPVMNDNKNKYGEQLSAQEIEVVETVCKPLMLQLGYQPTTAASAKFNRYFYQITNRIARRKSVSPRDIEVIISRKNMVKEIF